MESYNTLPAALSTRMSSILVVFTAAGAFFAEGMRRKITSNEPKAQIILYGISVLPLVFVCFVGHIHYILVLLALCLAAMMLQGAAPFSQSFIVLHFETYGRIGTVTGILNATASIGNVLASYIFAKMAELMSWHEVAISWFVAIIVCCLLCIAILPRWTKFIRKEE